jgi:hypothetical protein
MAVQHTQTRMRGHKAGMTSAITFRAQYRHAYVVYVSTITRFLLKVLGTAALGTGATPGLVEIFAVTVRRRIRVF